MVSVPELGMPVVRAISTRINPMRREQSASTIRTYGASFAKSDANSSANSPSSLSSPAKNIASMFCATLKPLWR